MSSRAVRQAPRTWAALVALSALLAGCGGSGAHGTTAKRSSRAAARHPPQPSGPRRPNIVFVLTDDLAENLVPYMPHVLQMQREGVSFSNYFVTDSLCCPSRASILTGRFPHDTRVYDNSPPEGGYAVFRERGEERETFATALQRQGYRTALMGKYLNGYKPNGAVAGLGMGATAGDGASVAVAAQAVPVCRRAGASGTSRATATPSMATT